MTYANVMATMAMFVALGGSSYAVTQLDRNSVRSRHIVNGQVQRSDLRNNAVNSAKVSNGSLLAQDFAAGQLPAGPQGPQGPQGERGPQGETGQQGPQGDAGATNVRWVRSPSATVVAPGASETTTVECAAGETATGGGATWGNGYNVDPVLQDSGPTLELGSTKPTGWRVRYRNSNVSGQNDAFDVFAFAICASP